ncbi:MAG: hypothetical protein RJA22_1923 [Verrucomicrobiota bacterium]
MGGQILAAWVVMLGLALGWAAAPVPLTNMSAFKRLTPQEAAGGIPVLFRGVVTGGAPSVGELFVQDGLQSVYLSPSQAGLEVQIGDLVEVAGVSVASFSPWVAPSRVTRLGTAPLPAARPANGQDLLSPAFLESRVQVEGVVRRAVPDVRYTDPRFGGPPISLGLLVSGERVTATVWKRGLDDQLLGLVGSYIRLTGVCTPVYNPQRQVVRGAIHVTAADTVEVLEPGPTNLFTLPRTALGDLLKHEVLAQPHSFTHVAGVVTAVASPHSFFLQDDRHTGIRVRTQQPMQFSAGDEVSLVGLARAEQGLGDPSLDRIISRLERTLVSFTAEHGIRLGSKPLPAPIPVTMETLDAVTNRHQRLSLAATVAAVGESLLPTDQQLTLSAGRHLIPVVFPSPNPGKLPALGSRVQVTGVLEAVGETDAEPMRLQLHVASLGDLVVLAPPPPNYVSLLSWAVLVACLGGAVALAWAFTMRQAVRARTAALAKTNRELAEASAAKGQFLAMMSHEIRNPMHAVLGFIQVLQRTSLPAPLRDIALRAAQSGRALTRLLEDLLEFSRVEAGHLRLEEHPFELSDLLRQVDESFAEAARRKGLDWRVRTEAIPAGRFVGDPVRIGQILTNLASNAIKFTSLGSVEVHAAVREMDQDRSTLRLEVRDTGPGIAPDALAKVFQPFVQANASIPHQYGGTGLGLAISRRLAELMLGRLGAESTPGQGSLFWVELPLRRTQAALAPPCATLPTNPPGGQPLQGRIFLIVDDNSLNLDMMAMALQQDGATTVPAISGQEALDHLRREPHRFDAVLVDIQMPGMDGLETTRAIRQELGLVDLPIVAVSAGVHAEQIRAALAAGANSFVPKPIEVAQLVTALQFQLPAPARSSFPPVPGLDLQHAATHLNHNRQFFLRSLRRFRDEFATLPREVREAGNATRPNDVADRLHNLRGIAGAIGALALCEAAATLENALRHADPDCDRLRITFAHQLEALLHEIDRVDDHA